MAVNLSTALVGTGALALLSSVSGAWFYLIPIGNASGPSKFFGVTLGGSWGSSASFALSPYNVPWITDPSSTQESRTETGFRVWEYVVFNRTVGDAGLDQDSVSWAWPRDPSQSLSPNDYGLLGSKAGYAFAAMIAVGALMYYSGLDYTINL